jgi:hypothetical protein
VGPVSTQAPLDWRLGEWGDEFIGVYTDANIVMGAGSVKTAAVSQWLSSDHVNTPTAFFKKSNFMAYES